MSYLILSFCDLIPRGHAAESSWPGGFRGKLHEPQIHKQDEGEHVTWVNQQYCIGQMLVLVLAILST